MTETLTFQQGRTYIVKDREGFNQTIKVLLIAIDTVIVEWVLFGTRSFIARNQIGWQEFKYNYQIVEEVG